MKLELDLSKMLDTMNKEAIMAELSKTIDIAVTRKIEEEAELAAYKKAQERVALGTYTMDDLRVLEKRIRVSVNEPTIDGNMPRIVTRPSAISTKVVSQREVSDILRALGENATF